ncbi:MAG: DUF3488 domain-containing transglutaminase family protein [Desulfobacterales bacterium]|nr:DUF3488 domain-containing transglutaminase family protein [Desulfobacterales bacterium]
MNYSNFLNMTFRKALWNKSNINSMSSTDNSAKTISGNQYDSSEIILYYIIVALLVAILPLLFILPIWIKVWVLVMWGYVYIGQKKQWRLPNFIMRHILFAFGMICWLASSGIRFDGQDYMALLAIMAGLKPLEIQTHRDRIIAVFLAYFCVIASLFTFENLSMTLYMFFSVFITTSVLIKLHQPKDGILNYFRLSFWLLIQSVPVMLISFFLFPRIQNSFWVTGLMARETTGFSDRLELGKMSRLIQREATAFKVKFNGPIPAPENLYWRGIIFDYFTGDNWIYENSERVSHGKIEGENPVDYEVILEPHGKKWVFALDVPVSGPNWAKILDDHTLRSYHNIYQKKRFRAVSYLSIQGDVFQTWDTKSLKLPADGNPKARAMAEELKKRSESPDQIIQSALDMFVRENFVYTLDPPMLKDDLIDDFLFRTRQGFCEHYASAFTFLMRASGIPSRIVGGYQGGEINPYDQYLIIRQSDAHVWVEVWLKGRGWVRIDPTAYVVPERIQRGVDAVLEPDKIYGFFSLRRWKSVSDFANKVRFAWGMINNQWEQWVMGYSYIEQLQLLKQLGIQTGTWKGAIQVLGLACMLILLFSAFYMIINQSRPVAYPEKVQKIYLKFCHKMAKAGYVKSLSQGPLDYMNSITTEDEHFKSKMSDIIDHYICIRYANRGNSHMLKQLNRLVSDINRYIPKKNSTKKSWN